MLNLISRSPFFGATVLFTPAENVVDEFENTWVLAVTLCKGEVKAEALSKSSLCGLIARESMKTFAVGVIVWTLAAPPVPPVPSLMNITPSPTENPSPGSVISKALIVASETEDTLTPASDPLPPGTWISSPTL